VIIPFPNASMNVVILHGWGANAQDAAGFATQLNLPVQLILPDAPFKHTYSDDGRMWYAIPEPVQEFRFDADLSNSIELQTSRQQLIKLLTKLPQKTGIPLERTILGGFSQGGAMTIDVGLDLPLAGLMVMSGYLHAPIHAPTNSIPPILQVHGTIDQVVPIAAANQTNQALVKIGAKVQYEVIPRMGHEISFKVVDYMRHFIKTKLV
jgi:phospholipase/carboxylesterase